MKLRNKKTGMIKDFIINKNKIKSSNGISYCEYNSFTELMKEWEDAPEEPKGMQWVDVLGANDGRVVIQYSNDEEAKKAVKKLKAWKRLKDKGFEFNGIKINGLEAYIKTKLKDNTGVTFGDAQEFYEDMELLFGGEE